MTLSAENYLAHVRAESARLGEVARMGLDAAVPSCPGWTVESVVRHVSQVYVHKVEVLRLGARPEEPTDPEATTAAVSTAVVGIW